MKDLYSPPIDKNIVSDDELFSSFSLQGATQSVSFFFLCKLITEQRGNIQTSLHLPSTMNRCLKKYSGYETLQILAAVCPADQTSFRVGKTFREKMSTEQIVKLHSNIRLAISLLQYFFDFLIAYAAQVYTLSTLMTVLLQKSVQIYIYVFTKGLPSDHVCSHLK